MAKRKPTSSKKPIEQYEHKDKRRSNNPPVGLVTPDTDKELPKKKYQYDPHLDPQLQWAGKAEHLSFDVDTVSLHVHERIDPRSIIEAVRKKNGSNYEQLSLFSAKEENPPLREAIDFYKHSHNWSNRMIAGDSLLVMNSLIEKEGLAGQVQIIYIDPPYGIKYGSNFQPFVNKRDVKDGKDEDLNQEPEMIKAFRDTWELGIHSYLSYLRDRLLLARELLNETGSCFVQISDENVHHVREIMDEVFGINNFANLITFRTATSQPRNISASVSDYLVWYCKDKSKTKFRHLLRERTFYEKVKTFSWIQLEDGTSRTLTQREISGKDPLPSGTLFKDANITNIRKTDDEIKIVEYQKKNWLLPSNLKYVDNIEILIKQNRIVPIGDRLCAKRYESDNPFVKYTNLWEDTIQGTFELTKDPKKYVVQTNPKVIQRCLLMCTDPGDLVFDPTCGGGTTAVVAEQWGRRWITCDTSRVSLTLAKQRLMTALFDYYELSYPEDGIGSGLKYKYFSHTTIGSIINNEPPATETLYDQPYVDNSKTRVTGPFTVEAVPAPGVKQIATSPQSSPYKGEEAGQGNDLIDNAIARSGETLRQSEWRAELYKTGIRGKNNQYIMFSRVEPLPGTKWIHADAETKPNDLGADSVNEKKNGYYLNPERAVISFGPEHAPLEQRQVALALEEANLLIPKPKLVIFAALQFDPEAAKDIDETNWPGMTLLKAQINTDLFTEDLKKKRSSNESFWLIGQPDVIVKKSPEAEGKKELYQVEVLGFDYYNTKTGNIQSGSSDQIAMWMLDTDYDGRSLFPRQVFFPMAGEKEGWTKLAKNLKAEIDEELIEAYRGTTSLPFEPGEHKRIAVKIVDDRGVESLKVVEII